MVAWGDGTSDNFTRRPSPAVRAYSHGLQQAGWLLLLWSVSALRGQQSDIQRNLRLATLSHSNLSILTRQAHASRRRMHLCRSRSQKYRNTRVGRAAGSSLRDRWAPLLSSLRKWAGNICATQVYDVTDFLSRHPGGANVILQHAGGDATYCFSSSHRIPCLKLSQ
jgi:hypothetical protein